MVLETKKEKSITYKVQMKLFNWFFNKHQCDHSKCISAQEHEAFKETAVKEVDSYKELIAVGTKYQSDWQEISIKYEQACSRINRLKQELAICLNQEKNYKRITENFEHQIKILQAQIDLLKKQKHLKSFEEYLKTRLTEQEIASVKQQAQQEVNRMETETKSVDS